MSIYSWKGRRALFRTVLVALVVAAGFATRPVQAVPALFTGLVRIPGQPSAHAIPGMPDAMFVVGDFTVESFENTYQVAETYTGDTTHQLDFSVMDTVTHATITTPSNAPAFTDAIALLSDSAEPEVNDTAVWSFSFSLPETLSEAAPADGSETAPGDAGHDKQVSVWGDGIKPGPGSAFLALGAVAVVAVFRWREGLRG
jgi:hypothetical protein